MKKLKLLSALAVLILLTGSVSAQQSTAPTVTLNVPLQLQKLHPSATLVQVYAVVLDASGLGVGSGTSAVIQIPPNGNLNQTCTVITQQSPGKDITLALHWRVILMLKGDNFEWTTPSSESTADPGIRIKEGTPYTTILNGDLTW